MEDTHEDSKVENQTLEDRVQSIIHWMNLADVPTAKDLDPEGKFGLEGAFRKVYGIYPDPIPSSIIDQAIEEVDASEERNSIEIPILDKTSFRTRIGKSTSPFHRGRTTVVTTGKGPIFPLFREQVDAVAQYLVRRGFKTPKPTPIGGKNFVLIGGVAEVKKDNYFPLDNPHLRVEFERSMPSENAPVTNVYLIVSPS